VDVAKMTPKEIQQHLAELEIQRQSALKTLEQLKEQGKYDLAQSIKDKIAEQGYTLEDILPLLGGKKRRTSRRKKVDITAAVMATKGPSYVDPDNEANVYSRGAIPEWFKQKMREQGLNPEKRSDRNAFRANHLKRVDA